MRPPNRFHPGALVLVLVAFGLPACVTDRIERVGPGASSPRVNTASTGNAGSKPATSARGPAAKLPDGPIAKPASTDELTNAHITVAINLLGRVPSDGLALPLVSPDGRFIAAQHGTPPSWPTVLAERGATVSGGTRISVYQVELGLISQPRDKASKSAPAAKGALKMVSLPNALPSGVLVGRSADSSGFLIESPRPDGSRWIGHAEWLTGKIRWLVQDDHINAHAVLGPTGALAFCRRTKGAETFELVYRPDDSIAAADHERVLGVPENSFLFPVFSSTPDFLYVFQTEAAPGPDSRMAIHAIDLATGAAGHSLEILSSTDALVTPSTIAAYQATASLQVPLIIPGSPSADPKGDEAPPPTWPRGLLFLYAQTRSMAWFDPESGLIAPLTGNSAAAAPLVTSGHPGFVTGTPQALLFQAFRRHPLPQEDGVFTTEFQVLAGAFLPRGTRNPDLPYILLAPPQSKNDQAFSVWVMSPSNEAESAQKGR